MCGPSVCGCQYCFSWDGEEEFVCHPGLYNGKKVIEHGAQDHERNKRFGTLGELEEHVMLHALAGHAVKCNLKPLAQAQQGG